MTRPVVFTSNRLVVVIAHGDPLHIGSVQRLKRQGLKIVMAAAGVPVGDYTRKVLARMGLSDLVGKAVSQETDVREVLAKVTLGEADAGFVYATDAKAVAGKVSLLGIPASAQPQVVYAAAAVKSSKHLQAAKAWIRRLLSKSAQKKLRAAGFLPDPALIRRAIAGTAVFAAAAVALGFLLLPIVAIFARVSPGRLVAQLSRPSRDRRAARQPEDERDRTGPRVALRHSGRLPACDAPLSGTLACRRPRRVAACPAAGRRGNRAHRHVRQARAPGRDARRARPPGWP